MKISHLETLEAVYYQERQNKAKYLTWNSVKLKFVRKTSMLDPAENLGYIKHYSSSSHRLAKRHSFFEGHNPPLFFLHPFLFKPLFFKMFPNPMLEIKPPSKKHFLVNPSPNHIFKLFFIHIKTEKKQFLNIFLLTC